MSGKKFQNYNNIYNCPTELGFDQQKLAIWADHEKLLVCYAPTYPSKLALTKNIYVNSGNMI